MKININTEYKTVNKTKMVCFRLCYILKFIKSLTYNVKLIIDRFVPVEYNAREPLSAKLVQRGKLKKHTLLGTDAFSEQAYNLNHVRHIVAVFRSGT